MELNLSYYDKMALASYTSAERQALYQMLCGMMIIDGYSDPREKAVIEEVIAAINLSSQERIASRTISTEEQMKTLKDMEMVKKCYVAKFLAQVALADGKVSREEQLFFSYYSKVLGLPENP